jgi:hypothetical protein
MDGASRALAFYSYQASQESKIALYFAALERQNIRNHNLLSIEALSNEENQHYIV